MIERVVRCLETGGRCFLRVPKKPFRSRRALHSTFWAHGAGNIDLPSWWIALLQVPQTGSHACKSGGARDGIQEKGFMDFLYPAQTVAFFQRLVSRDITALLGHRRKRTAQLYSRAYTSSATDAEDEARERLGELLGDADSIGANEELWKTYQRVQDKSVLLSPAELIELLRRLSTSKTKVDMERLLTIFNMIPVTERRAVHYEYAIIASLDRNDLEMALGLHREALPRIQGSLGTSAILRYTVEREQWRPAIDTWHGYWFYREMYFERPNIWTEVDALPLSELMDKATSAADFAINMAESTGRSAADEAAVAAREFALQLIRRSFDIHGVIFDLAKGEKLFEKVKGLKEPGLKLYKASIEQLLSIDNPEHGSAAIRRYRELRKTSSVRPEPSLMNAVTDRFCAVHSSTGLFMMLEDYQRYHGGPSASTLKKIIFELAQQGNEEAVFNLFENFQTRFGKPKNPDLYHSLLRVYFRRGQVEKVVEIFQNLSKDYEFVPDIGAWNLVISTFARVGDGENALSWFLKLAKNDLKPDSHTYTTMMAMYAKRGDLEAVVGLFQRSRSENIKTTVGMMSNLVLAQVNNGQLAEAQKTAEQALQIGPSVLPVRRTLTCMWNIILNAYATRSDLEKVSEIHRLMQEAGVPSDSMTYAALLQSLTVAKQPDAARKILQVVMPRSRIRASPVHYAIVMGGFLATGEYHKIFALYARMLKRNVMPVPSTQNVVLRAAASVDIEEASKEGVEGAQIDLSRAREILDQTLSTMDPQELARNEPMKFFGVSRLDEAYSSSYFSYLIFLYGRRNAFDKIAKLYDRYTATAHKFRQNLELSPPIQMLSALMVAHLQANEHEEVERCWYLALDRSEKLARRSTSSSVSQPGWVLPARRFIMNTPLLHYLKSLESQVRIDDLTATIDDLLTSGYALTSKSWNAYIQVLVRNGRALRAYELCETQLMDGWPGWEAMGGTWTIRSRFKAMAPKRLQPERRMPSYPTLVFLAGAYMDAQAGAGAGALEELRTVAPRTVDAMRNMPKLEDEWQERILRRY